MWWNIPLSITTLSRNVGSMRLFPECPWRGKGFFPNYQSNTDMSFSNLLLLPNKMSNDHQTNAVYLWGLISKMKLNSVELLHLLPAVLLDCRRRLITFFDTSYAARVCSDGSISIHLLSCIGMIVGVSTGSLCCGFAFAFDLAATTLILVFGTWSSCGSAGISVLSWIESITYLTVP